MRRWSEKMRTQICGRTFLFLRLNLLRQLGKGNGERHLAAGETPTHGSCDRPSWVAAAADDKWIDDNGQGEWVAVAEDGLLSFCNELQDWEAEDYDTICSVYKAFTAMQIIGTIACSVSVVLLALACFLPAAGGCASVRTFALMGGALMATYALFQLLAVVLAGVMKQKLNGVSDDSDDGFTGYGYGYGYYDFSDGGYEADMGPTFGVGVSGLIFAVIVATLLLLCARRAGAGPLHECCRSLMIANKNNPSIFGSGGIGGGGGAADGTQRAAASAAPLPVPQATGTDTTSAAAAHHHQEAVPPPLEAVPLSEPQTTSSGGAPPPPQAAARTAAAAAALTGEQQIPFPRYDVLPPAPE
ncbi:unnamed protein product [Pylaiella littoralis]